MSDPPTNPHIHPSPRNAYQNGLEGKSFFGQGYTSAFEGLAHADGEMARAAAETAKLKSSSAGGSASDSGAGLAEILLLPPLIPPGFLVYLTWNYLGEQHWDFWPKLLGVAGEIGALIFIIVLFYKLVPAIVASVFTSLYMAYTYGMAMAWLTKSATWQAGGVMLAGVLGYFFGRTASESSRNRATALIFDFAASAIGVAMIACGRDMAMRYSAPLWFADDTTWAGMALASVSVFALIGRFPWVFIVTATAVATCWIEFPEFLHRTFVLTAWGSVPPK